MLQLSDDQLDKLCELLPDHPDRPLGGRPRLNKRTAIEGIFWILDNGAKWKDLPPEFGTKSSVHRAFQRWVKMGAFESLLVQLGSMVEERGRSALPLHRRTAAPGALVGRTRRRRYIRQCGRWIPRFCVRPQRPSQIADHLQFPKALPDYCQIYPHSHGLSPTLWPDDENSIPQRQAVGKATV